MLQLFVVLNVEMDLVLEQLPDRLCVPQGLSFSPVSALLSVTAAVPKYSFHPLILAVL